MSKKEYSAVPVLEDEQEFNPRALPTQTAIGAPGGLSIPPSSSLPQYSKSAGSSSIGIELTSFHSNSQHERSSDSTTSSIAGDENTTLVNHDEEDDSASSKPVSSSPSTVGGLIILDPQPPGPNEITVTLMRLGGSGLGNIQVNVSLDSTISQLARRVFASEIAEGKKARLLYMGRILQDVATVRQAGVANGNILHALLTQMPQGAPLPIALPVGDVDPNVAAPAAQPQVLLHTADGSAYPGNVGQPVYSDYEIALMQQQQDDAVASQYATQRNGTNADFVCGLALGLFLGVISLIWLINPSLTRKQRLGILLGIALNFLWGIRNVQKPTDGSDGSQSGSSSDSGGSGNTDVKIVGNS